MKIKLNIVIVMCCVWFGMGCDQKKETIVKAPQVDMKSIIGDTLIIELNKPDSSYQRYWCSMDVLKKTEESLENLNIILVAEFLASFYEGCRTNKAYTQKASRLLFQVLERETSLVLGILEKNSSIDKKLILNYLQNAEGKYDNMEFLAQIEELGHSVTSISKVESLPQGSKECGQSGCFHKG